MIVKQAAILMLPVTLMLAACNESQMPSLEKAAAAAPAVNTAAVEGEVRAFIEEYNGYYGANDADRYFASFDPALTQWWPSGRVDLKTYETGWRRGIATGGGAAKAVVTDLQVQVGPSGDAAVATYLLEVTSRKNGQPILPVERNQETDVLFKRNGEWKIVHVNYGPAAAPKPQ